MDILIFGTVCIDHNVTESGKITSWGGTGMFISKILSQLPQTNTTVICNYGPDYLEYLKGINIYPLSPSVPNTLVYENVSQGKTRTQKALFRDNSEPVEITQDLKSKIENAHIIFFAPLLPNLSTAYIHKVTQLANKESLKVLLPQGYFRSFDSEDNVIPRDFQEAAEMLPLVDFAIISDQDTQDVDNVAQNWAEKTGVQVIVTRGEDGASIISKEESQVVPTKAVPLEEIVDSVGSGDTFSAGFAYQYYLTKDITKSLRFANKLAAAKLYFKPKDIKFDYAKLLD
jgi:sugar/nucleoside kinase (ribokinase family)